MEARLQRRVQRSGWNLAAADYEMLWRNPLAPAQRRLLECAALQAGDRVLDVACGTGLVTFAAAPAVAPGRVVGIDVSERMIAAAQRQAAGHAADNAEFARMEAEQLAFPDASFDVALCALGLMYVADAACAIHEMRRVLRPGGRLAVAVWGERANCGWASVFPIVAAEVKSEVCPLFFRLGAGAALTELCTRAGFADVAQQRFDAALAFPDEQAACDAAFVGGPVALAWSRFDTGTRARVRARYLDAIAPWREGSGYRLPGEFVVVSARRTER